MPMTKDEKKKKIETIIRETIASIEGGEPELPFDDNDPEQRKKWDIVTEAILYIINVAMHGRV